jgi:hypothetical protein
MICRFNSLYRLVFNCLKPGSSIGIGTGSGLDGWDSIHGRGVIFSLFQNVQTGSGAQTTFYPMGIGGFIRGNKVAAE